MSPTPGALDRLGRAVLAGVEEMRKIILLFISVFSWMFRPPLKLHSIFKQMEFVGVKSIFVVVRTGTFTGMVMALQGYRGFRMFGAGSLVSSTVALGMTRELGPVLMSLMVTAQATVKISPEPLKHRLSAGIRGSSSPSGEKRTGCGRPIGSSLKIFRKGGKS